VGISFRTMATHQCTACLKKTIEDCDTAGLPDGFVFPTTVCAAPIGGNHSWVAIQQSDASVPQAVAPVIFVVIFILNAQ